MPEAEPAPTTVLVFDTGPLLCFGCMPGGIRFIRNWYHQRMRWIEAVVAEVSHHAGRPPTSYRNKALANAAGRWSGPDKSAVGDPYICVDRAQVDEMRERVRAASMHPTEGNTDLGESETLL